jgi:hypothetical protein
VDDSKNPEKQRRSLACGIAGWAHGGGQRGRPWVGFISAESLPPQNEYEAVSSRIRGCRIADGSMNFAPDCMVSAVTMLLLAAL